MDATYNIVGTNIEAQFIIVEYEPPSERSYLKTIRRRIRLDLDATTTEQDLMDAAAANVPIEEWEEQMYHIQNPNTLEATAEAMAPQTVTLPQDLESKRRGQRRMENQAADEARRRGARSQGANDALDV